VTSAHAQQPPPAQEGFVLIEVLVSAVVLVIVAGAVFTLLTATARSAAEGRHRSEAFALAQEDQARMRAMRMSELTRLPTLPRTVPLNGTQFEVHSTSVFIEDKTATSSCSQGESSADYLRTASEVTWPGMKGSPVSVQSIVSPSNGSLDPSHGTLTFSVARVGGAPIPGVSLTSSGFNGTTDANGCVTFPDLVAGNYTVTPSGATAGLVDKDGKAPGQLTAGVSAETTTLVQLRYDVPGKANISFRTKSSPTGVLVPSSADSIVVSNNEMSEPKVFGTPGGSRVHSIAATPLFPSPSPDAVYAGSCSINNPNPSGETNPPGAAAIASVTIPPNGIVEGEITLPALYLTVWKGTLAKPETAVGSANVTVVDKNCKVGSTPVKRTYSTNIEGHLGDPGLPWSTYEVCADNGTRHQTVTGVEVKSLTSGTTLNLYLGSGTTGKCP
jgi:Tfp pilus assembly protein PilV